MKKSVIFSEEKLKDESDATHNRMYSQTDTQTVMSLPQDSQIDRALMRQPTPKTLKVQQSLLGNDDSNGNTNGNFTTAKGKGNKNKGNQADAGLNDLIDALSPQSDTEN